MLSGNLSSEKKAKRDLSQLLATLSREFGVQPFFTWTIGVNDQVSCHTYTGKHPSLAVRTLR
jgi:hypothetical protein